MIQSKYEKLGPVKMPLRTDGTVSLFSLFLYVFTSEQRYYVLQKGDIIEKERVLVRIDSKCVYAHIFGSARCDCAEQLHEGIRRIHREGEGLLIYAYDQDGRGIDLKDHLRVYVLQDEGYDTVEANLIAGLKPDQRSYTEVAKILQDYKLNHIRLLTNNPDRVKALEEQGIKVERIPFSVAKLDRYNAAQLIVKQTKLGHLYGWDLDNPTIKNLFEESLKGEYNGT